MIVEEFLMNEIETCVSIALHQLRTHPKELLSVSQRRKIIWWRRVGLYNVYSATARNKCSRKITVKCSQEPFSELVQICSNSTASSLKGSGVIAYPVQGSLLNLSDAYKWWLLQSKHCIAAFVLVECARNCKVVIANLHGQENLFKGTLRLH